MPTKSRAAKSLPQRPAAKGAKKNIDDPPANSSNTNDDADDDGSVSSVHSSDVSSVHSSELSSIASDDDSEKSKGGAGGKNDATPAYASQSDGEKSGSAQMDVDASGGSGEGSQEDDGDDGDDMEEEEEEEDKEGSKQKETKTKGKKNEEQEVEKEKEKEKEEEEEEEEQVDVDGREAYGHVLVGEVAELVPQAKKKGFGICTNSQVVRYGCDVRNGIQMHNFPIDLKKISYGAPRTAHETFRVASLAYKKVAGNSKVARFYDIHAKTGPGRADLVRDHRNFRSLEDGSIICAHRAKELAFIAKVNLWDALHPPQNPIVDGYRASAVEKREIARAIPDDTNKELKRMAKLYHEWGTLMEAQLEKEDISPCFQASDLTHDYFTKKRFNNPKMVFACDQCNLAFGKGSAGNPASCFTEVRDQVDEVTQLPLDADGREPWVAICKNAPAKAPLYPGSVDATCPLLSVTHLQCLCPLCDKVLGRSDVFMVCNFGQGSFERSIHLDCWVEHIASLKKRGFHATADRLAELGKHGEHLRCGNTDHRCDRENERAFTPCDICESPMEAFAVPASCVNEDDNSVSITANVEFDSASAGIIRCPVCYRTAHTTCLGDALKVARVASTDISYATCSDECAIAAAKCFTVGQLTKRIEGAFKKVDQPHDPDAAKKLMKIHDERKLAQKQRGIQLQAASAAARKRKIEENGPPAAASESKEAAPATRKKSASSSSSTSKSRGSTSSRRKDAKKKPTTTTTPTPSAETPAKNGHPTSGKRGNSSSQPTKKAKSSPPSTSGPIDDAKFQELLDSVLRIEGTMGELTQGMRALKTKLLLD